MHPIVLALILGVVQGLGEFLPISSSGHLVLMQAVLGLEEPEIFLDLILHLGTLTAVIFFYRADLGAMLRELASVPSYFKSGRALALAWRTQGAFRLGVLVAVGSIPTALIGLGSRDFLEPLFAAPRFVGGALLLTGAVVYFTGRRPDGCRDLPRFGLTDALIIGTVQGLAIAPGLSRSGLTIGVALLLGLRRDVGAKYSFILSIPAIMGAVLLEARGGLGQTMSTAALVIGFLVAALVGYLSLSFLIKIIKGGRFAWFAFWCWGVGLLALAFL